MKRAFLVIGPESSGTKLMTSILMKSGCMGSNGDVQAFDAAPPKDDIIVWRRSVPHAKAWPDLSAMVEGLRESGYDVMAVVTTRDWLPMAMSQVSHGHVRDMHEAFLNLQQAYKHIFEGLDYSGVPYVMCHYEALWQRPAKVVEYVLKLCGLVMPAGIIIYDGNEKWYEQMFPLSPSLLTE